MLFGCDHCIFDDLTHLPSRRYDKRWILSGPKGRDLERVKRGREHVSEIVNIWETEPDSCCSDLGCKYYQPPSQVPCSALGYTLGDFVVPLYREVPLLVSRSFRPPTKDIPARATDTHSRTNAHANEALHKNTIREPPKWATMISANLSQRVVRLYFTNYCKGPNGVIEPVPLVPQGPEQGVMAFLVAVIGPLKLFRRTGTRSVNLRDGTSDPWL